MLLTYDSASLDLQPAVLLENTFTIDDFTQSVNVTLERVPYDDVKGNGTITGFTYEEISAGVQTPIMCTVRLVDSNDNSVVYREVYSSLDDGSYAFTGIRDRSMIGQTYDIIAKPTTANYYKKIIEGINPSDDLVQFKLLGVDSVSHVYQNQVSSITFKYESDSFIPDLQVVCDRPVEVDPYSKTITIMYSSNIVGNTLQDITFISSLFEFVRSYQLPFNVIVTTLGYYLFDGNTNNEYGSDTLTVNGTTQYRDNAFIFDGNTKLQSNTSRFLFQNTRNQFMVSFKFCLYSINDNVLVNQLFSTTETARGDGSLYIFVVTNNTSGVVDNRGRLRINWKTGDAQVVSQHAPIVQPLTEHVVTLVYEVDRLMLCLDGYVLHNVINSAFAINDGFVLGGSNVTTGFVTQSSINGYISDFQYTRGLITTHNSIEDRPYYADYSNFSLLGSAGSLVDNRKNLWVNSGGNTTFYPEYIEVQQRSHPLGIDNTYSQVLSFGTGEFFINWDFYHDTFFSVGLIMSSSTWVIQVTSSYVRFYDSVSNTFNFYLDGEWFNNTGRHQLTLSRTSNTLNLYSSGILVSSSQVSFNIPTTNNILFNGFTRLYELTIVKGVSYNNGRI